MGQAFRRAAGRLRTTTMDTSSSSISRSKNSFEFIKDSNLGDHKNYIASKKVCNLSKFEEIEANDRKIGKLCDYASKNLLRVPKITEYLEQRFYRKCLASCKEQMNVECCTMAYYGIMCKSRWLGW